MSTIWKKKSVINISFSLKFTKMCHPDEEQNSNEKY